MKFYHQFKWAVPYAFTDAIANCLFTEGDILYNSQEAYTPWNNALNTLKHSLQILHPSSQTLNTFIDNWFSQVNLRFYNYNNGNITNKEYITTTQGRIFQLLWKGDSKILDIKTPEPQPPLFIKELRTLLKRDLNIHVSKEEVIFVMPYDPLNAVAIEKNIVLDVLLKKDFQLDTFDILPSEANIPECIAFSFAPTISFKCYRIKSIDITRVTETLKNALYRPQKNRTASGHFNLEKHGILICPTSVL